MTKITISSRQTTANAYAEALEWEAIINGVAEKATFAKRPSKHVKDGKIHSIVYLYRKKDAALFLRLIKKTAEALGEEMRGYKAGDYAITKAFYYQIAAN